MAALRLCLRTKNAVAFGVLCERREKDETSGEGVRGGGLGICAARAIGGKG